MNTTMLNQLSITEKLAVAVSSSVLAALAFLACLKLTLAPNYTDFIVGNITWQANTKLQDIIVAPVSIVVLFLGYIYLSLQLGKQKRQFGSDYSINFSNQLIWWSIPAFSAVSSLILGTPIDQTLFIISALGISFIAITVAYNSSKLINISPEIISLSVFSIMLIGLIPLEIALILGRLPIRFIGDIKVASYEDATYILTGFGVAVGLFYAMRDPGKLTRFLPRLALIGQVGLSTLFLTFYPARLFQPNGDITKYQTSWALKVLVVAMIIVGIFDVVRRHRKYSAKPDGHCTYLFSPIALFALLIALKVGSTALPYISPDDYHFGEMLLGAWSYLHGAIPYVDYLPPHGVIPDDLSAFLSFIFHDGTAGSLIESRRLGYALLASAAFISIYRFSGSIGLAFISIFFVGSYSSWLFFTPFLCVWFSRSLTANPSRWLGIWILTAPIVILGVPGQGLLLVTASGVMAVNFAWRLLHSSQTRAWRDIGIPLTILVFLGLVTPLGSMLFGAIRYVMENGQINQVAYGIPWSSSWNVGINKGFVFEAIRMSWVAIPVALLAIVYASRKAQADRKNLLLPVFVILIFLLLLIPYSMGRIDPGGVSRPGLVAVFGWAILLPMVFSLLRPDNKVSLMLLVAVLSATLNFTSLSFSNLVSAASAQISTSPLRDGSSAGLSNIGKAEVKDEHWDRLIRLNKLLNRSLAPNESYLDLTSRNAQYFYLNRRPVIAVTAPYNLVSPSQQRRVVEHLAKNLPRLALLEGDNIIHDGGGLALRNPYLYRFILDNYTPRQEDGFIIGHKKTEADGSSRKASKILNPGRSRLLDGSSSDPTAIEYQNGVEIVANSQRKTEHSVSLFEKAFARSDFGKIPIAWGRSEKSLQRKMTLIKSLDGIDANIVQLISENGSYKITGLDPQLSLDISSLKLSGHDAGLLRFDFSCIGNGIEPRIQVFWWGDDREGPFEASSVRFTAGNGPLIVPLDASPRWLTLKHIKGIRIDLDNASACSRFSAKNLGLFQRLF